MPDLPAPMSANLFRVLFLKLTQKRHPERSASQLIAYTALVARSRRTSAVPGLPMLLRAFRPPKSDSRICFDAHLMVRGTSFHEDRGGAVRSRLGD
jgi:hypothetical protein